MDVDVGMKENLGLTENAIKVLERRYFRKDEKGNILETSAEMFRRVAENIAQADLFYDKKADIKKTENEFYSAMSKLEFLPNSPTLMNAGRDLQQLSACFVLPIEDSMEGIFETLKSAALIHKSGGGTGFSFSRLRSKNSAVKTTGGVASGPVSFMKVYDASTQAVKQGGTRRGANMGILRVDHPDILEFIQCKEKDKEISNFNISVGITENFMKKMENDEEYDLIDPRTKQVVDKLKAKEIFDLIVKMAWKNGEPGIVFLDRLNIDNPTPSIGAIESTNPCGEQPLLPYESCNLGSIDLSKMVDEENKSIDWEKLSYVTKVAVHFLDNVIDMNKYPLKEIDEMTKSNRKIGLGVMGFADLLIKLNVSYDSQEAVKRAKNIMKFILKEAEKASCELAEKRGAFPNFEKSIYSTPTGPRLRNASLTTIAPTGTLSIIAGCSSGIEPLFAVSYVRTVMDKDVLPETNPYFEAVAKEKGFYTVELMKLIAQKGSIQEIPEIPEDIRRVFITSHDTSPEWHIRMQAAFQEYTNNAVSKTVNFCNNAKEEDVRKVYTLACKLGCKGVTIYRDGSRDEQVLSLKKEGKTSVTEKGRKISPKPRPAVIRGTTTKVGTGCGNLYVTMNEDESGLPFEVFMQMGKAGGCAMSQLEAIGRLLSLAMRSGIDINSIIEQLRGIRCPSPSWEKGGRIFSCSDAIARVIEKQLIKAKSEDKPSAQPNTDLETFNSRTSGKVKLGSVVGVCPDCGGALRHEEGCMVCHSCGYSKCG